MSESIGGSLLSLTESNQASEFANTGPPLQTVSAYEDNVTRHTNNILPSLPSHRFRFSVWHDLSHTDVQGSQLKAPRVRDGPPIKKEMFYKLQDQNGRRVHHSFRGKQLISYRDVTEDWEVSKKVNLSYQDLCHNYQRDNLLRVLKRLPVVEELNLMEDGLLDVSSVHLPRCTTLNMSMNYLKSFKHLPRLSKIEHLILDDNSLDDTRGISSLRNTPIISLSLKRNPIVFTLNYRQNVFSKLPGLKCLDGLPKQPEDNIFDENQPSTCVLS